MVIKKKKKNPVESFKLSFQTKMTKLKRYEAYTPIS